MRIGLLGGTFNPVHNGHLAITRQTREAIGLDQILFVPSNHPPHKSHDNLAPAKDRYEMVRLAIASNPSLAISDVELRRPGKSYSVDTIRLLQQEYGAQTELVFLIGLDAFLDFPSWRDPRTILELCPFVVLSDPACRFVPSQTSHCFHRFLNPRWLTSIRDGSRALKCLSENSA